MAILEHIQRMRIETAIGLLKDTDLCIRNVTFGSAYNDVNFFYKLVSRCTSRELGPITSVDQKHFQNVG